PTCKSGVCTDGPCEVRVVDFEGGSHLTNLSAYIGVCRREGVDAILHVSDYAGDLPFDAQSLMCSWLMLQAEPEVWNKHLGAAGHVLVGRWIGCVGCCGLARLDALTAVHHVQAVIEYRLILLGKLPISKCNLFGG